MKNKIYPILTLNLILTVLFIGLASAVVTFSNVPTLSQSGNSAQITATSNINETVQFTIDDISYRGKTITFNPISNVNMISSQPQTIPITYTIPSNFDFKFGESFSTTLTSQGLTSNDIKTQTITFVASDFCSFGNEGNLDVSIRNINVNGFSSNDNEWYPFDEVEIEVKVENNGNDDINNVGVAWCLYDNENDNCVTDNTESDFNLNDGKDKTITIKFTLDPNDLEPGVTDYTFHVSATGEISSKDNNLDGKDSCETDSENIDLIIPNDFVILSDIAVNPNPVQCNSDVQINAKVWNIGDDDQNDIKVRVSIDDLSLNKEVEIGDIDSFDNDKLSLTLNIPKDAKEQNYALSFLVLNEDDDVYESDDNEDSLFEVPLQVEGGCSTSPTPTGRTPAVVAATLSQGSVPKAGKEFMVEVSITNVGTEPMTFSIDANDFEDWSTVEIDQSSIIVNSAQVGKVTLRVNVNDDAFGEKIFNIEVKSGNNEPVIQPLSVTIEPSSSGGFKFPGISGGVIGINGNNWYLWGIGLLNVVLVIIIIIIAIRVAKS